MPTTLQCPICSAMFCDLKGLMHFAQFPHRPHTVPLDFCTVPLRLGLVIFCLLSLPLNPISILHPKQQQLEELLKQHLLQQRQQKPQTPNQPQLEQVPTPTKL